jgi:tRNA 2-thiouridine synthesizing protein A
MSEELGGDTAHDQTKPSSVARPPSPAVLDAGQTGCGELVMLIFQRMKTLGPGERLTVLAYDAAAEVDIPAWCRTTGQRLVQTDLSGRPKRFVIEKIGPR